LPHGGALFLDEIVEFAPKVLETLREPLEEGAITISRAGSTATYPARFTLVAAMNPCPCGHAGDPAVPCRCLPDAIERYRNRLSGPILDRIDLRVHVPRIPYERLRDEPTAEPSAAVRARVIAARERMCARSSRPNAELGTAALRRHCRLDEAADALIGTAMRTRRLSPRAYHRILRVARTAADLAGHERITADDVGTALLLRAQP